MHNH
jgi:poly [ADP-ribose] polymerase